MNLDSFSKKILRLLQRDARQSVQEISDSVGLSSTPCWRRIKEMEQSGVIQRYTALLDREKLGLHICALAHIHLTRHHEGGVESFEREIAACPEVTECYSTTGEADYILKIVAADIKAYDAFLHARLFNLPAVAQVRTSVVLREVKFDTQLPL
ncbi:Lrp/AsnC family transcriptional regulator [Chitinasiproducens palmae]|uniref:DNA-binding transcriptional regulator, Lrp family n=1 Tax=Chitinasiproducens palmae TaxID=1770053 RepID=A0A1H2PPA9_9BURK|nr:Lrp/AsnC family transcriptional regulator [Chitinasiproducens palmae]SDV48588.1 DNA-binding transcriptional regulator, Lrp family [Chitinasiproducens palmae]